MIDEGTLAGLLAAHAERIPVPPSAVDALLAASPLFERNPAIRRFSGRTSRVVVAAAALVVAAGGVWALGAHSDGRSPAVRASASKLVTVSPPTSSAAAVRGFPPRSDGGVQINGGFGAAAPKSLSQDSAATLTALRSATTPGATGRTDSARVVRTGTLDLRIARHGFGSTIGRITTIAAAAGGYIADARTFESAAIPSGTVTLRIPSARFNATVERLRTLGTVVSASTRGVDVTGQYTDLQARLRAASATRDRFLTVLSQAVNIGDILAVQDRIQAVQTQIEQLQGQIQQLDDQTTFGTITISVNEPGPKPKAVAGPVHRSGLAIAWDNARGGFARRVEGLISHSGSALVVLLGLLLAGGALRLLVPRMRRLFV
jgi:hypothetical protein